VCTVVLEVLERVAMMPAWNIGARLAAHLPAV
jgi:hypothetical protein